MKDEKAAVINVLPQEVMKQSIPLGIKLPDAGNEQVTLKVEGLDELNEYLTVYLEDKVTGTMVDLRSTSEYVFTAKASTINDRLVLHFDEPISTDIENPTGEEAVSVYAYQKDGMLMVFENILAGQSRGEIQIELYSITGSKVLEHTYQASGLHALPANLASGTYLVKVSTQDSEPHVVKVVIR